MQRLLAAALVLALSTALSTAARAQDAPSPSPPARDVEVEAIRHAQDFDGEAVGFGAATPEAVHALRLVVERPTARADLLALLDDASPAGRLYALCGLWLVDPAAFQRGLARVANDETPLSVCEGGCLASRRPIREVVRSTSPFVMRLKAPSLEWTRPDGWPAEAYPVRDIASGGWPALVLRHDPWGAPDAWARAEAAAGRGPAHWRAEVERVAAGGEEGDEAPDLALAHFGQAGLAELQSLLGSESVAVRRLAGDGVVACGFGRFGPHTPEVARLAARCLADADPEVRTSGAQALYDLWSWSAPALDAVFAALERVPADATNERDLQLLVTVAARSPPQGRARVEALRQHRCPLVREAADDELAFFDREAARPARGAEPAPSADEPPADDAGDDTR